MNKHLNLGRISLLALLFALSSLASPAVMAQDSDWQYSADIYFWTPKMTAVTPGGREATLPFYKILDNLEMAFMGGARAQKDKWSLSADIIYMNLSEKVNRDASYAGDPLELDGDVKLKSWIVTPTVGYALLDSEQSRVEIFGGARYLWLKTSAGIDKNGDPLFNKSDSSGYWDAVVGLRGKFDLNEKWFIPAYIDVGTGDTKSTWQGFAGLGYQFQSFKAVLGYRYLKYKFDNDNPVLGKMIVKGPIAGVVFNF
jgi:hypothetical protein